MVESRGPAVPKSDGSGRIRGAALSLAAAALFGVFAPTAKEATALFPPVRAAGLSYVAAGLIGAGALCVLRRRAPAAGRTFRRSDVPVLAAMIAFGGLAGPVLFFAGVHELAAHQAAALQNLEFGLTVLAAVLVLGERPGPAGVAGLVLVATGLLVLTGGFETAPQALSTSGLLLVGGACVAWAVDNTLARRASELDPLAVVATKGLVAGFLLCIASGGGSWSLSPRGWMLVATAGGIGVGASLVLELSALRRIGAALNAGLFATGPAFAFLWSVLLLGESARPADWAAIVLMGAGAAALSADRHRHAHVHEPLRHAHRHTHEDGHHGHAHAAGQPAQEHLHEHEHGADAHSHPHVHDEHHRHRHGRPPGRRSGR